MYHLPKFTTIILLILTILASPDVWGQQKNGLIIALDMNDCPSCYNHLRNIKKLQPNIDVTFILPLKYREDSNAVKESLQLNNASFKFVWSDSLNKQLLIKNQFSSVMYINRISGKTIKYDLKTDFDESLLSYFNKLSNPSDTFRFEDRVKTSGTPNIVNKGTNIYTQDKIRNSISKFNMISGKRDFEIKLSDTLAKKAFYARYKDDLSYIENKRILDAVGIIKDKGISTFCINKDNTISILTYYVFFSIINRPEKKDIDTLELKFNVIHEFNDQGKYLSTAYIKPISVDYLSNEYLTDPSKFDSTYYGHLSSSLMSVNDQILLSIRRTDTKGPFKNYFAAYYSKNKDGDYVFNHFYEKELPADYEGYGYNLCNMKFSNNGKYFNLPLSSSIYNTTDTSEISFNILKEKQFTGLPFNFKMIYSNSNIQRGIAYFFIYDNQKKIYEYSKYDTKTLKLLTTKLLGSDPKLYNDYLLDDIDCNYLLLPIDDKTLVRTLIF